MKQLLDLAAAIATEAGRLQRQLFDKPHQIETKSSTIDLVTEVDRASEKLITERIRKVRPDDGILSEEAEQHEGRSGLRWVIDPLDGTTNYAHGFPHYSVSIGVEGKEAREVGVIYDPAKDELFTALRGGGAFLNGKPIRVSKTTDLARALLATGFAYDVHDAKIDNLDNFARFLKRARAVRRAGSAALDLAYVACGRLDGFWELNLHAWDVAAGLLLVEEAGGRTSDFDGTAAPASGVRVVASNGSLHQIMLEVLSNS